ASSMGVTLPIAAPLVAGRYTVAWRTAASDGHASSGKFSFVVAANSAAPAVDSGQRPKPVSNAVVEPAAVTTFSTATRWAELVALLTMIGLVILRLAVIPAAK